MLELFVENIKTYFPELKDATTLLAVSGGKDSVVLAHLFAEAGLSFAIAHVNFCLRGKESDGDQEFVRSLAKQFKVTFHTTRIDTYAIVAEEQGSIQMIARDLRYKWLEEIRVSQSYAYVATAHHLNDSIETVFINQVRGTGLKGLTGVPFKNEKIIRPLLSFERVCLEEYLLQKEISFREDSSNAKLDYQRNRIRHQLIPILKELNPGLERTFQKNIRIWSESAYLFEWACQKLKKEYVSDQDENLRIDYQFAIEHPEAALSLLWEWTKKYGFHQDQLKQAIGAIGQGVGIRWFSSSHCLLADRGAFLVDPIPSDTKPKVINVPSTDKEIALERGQLKLDFEDRKLDPKSNNSSYVAYLDADKVKFPLRLRHWQAGDFFHPLGMKGKRKKLQDFFTDNKISRLEKDKIWLVLDRLGNIIWVVGHRIDERFKIRDQTEKTLILQFKTNDP